LAPETPEHYRACVARLTGDSGSFRNHVYMYRITVTSSDGKKCSVNIRVSGKKVYKNTPKQIANSLRLDPAELDNALENWKPADTRKHLEKFSKEVLDSPADLRLFAQKN
jgi:hypothetical protein